MAASFNPELPEDKDWLRLHLNDMDTHKPLLQDEAYGAILAENDGDRVAALIQLAPIVDARAADRPDRKTVDNTTESYANAYKGRAGLNKAVASASSSGFQMVAPERGEDECSEYYASANRAW